MSAPSLEFVDEQRAPIPLPTGESIIGRGPGATIPISGAGVSERHVRLTVQPDGVFVEDLETRTGTLCNGTRVYGKQALRDGDRLEIGVKTIVFRGAAVAGEKASAEQATMMAGELPEAVKQLLAQKQAHAGGQQPAGAKPAGIVVGTPDPEAGGEQRTMQMEAPNWAALGLAVPPGAAQQGGAAPPQPHAAPQQPVAAPQQPAAAPSSNPWATQAMDAPDVAPPAPRPSIDPFGGTQAMPPVSSPSPAQPPFQQQPPQFQQQQPPQPFQQQPPAFQQQQQPPFQQQQPPFQPQPQGYPQPGGASGTPRVVDAVNQGAQAVGQGFQAMGQGFSNALSGPVSSGASTNDVVRDKDKVMLVLSYLGLLALVPYLTVKDSEYVKWHARQGLALMITEVGFMIAYSIVVTILVRILPILGVVFSLLGLVINLGLLAVFILAIVKAFKPQRWEIPIVSKVAEKLPLK